MDRLLYALDGATGTADAAFLAHILPLKHWALAWWEQWRPSDELENAFWSARRWLNGGKGSAWSRTIGPAAAMILTSRRIGWEWSDARTVKDDEGRILDMLLDPPVAVIRAVKASVRRWRFANIASSICGLVPESPDITSQDGTVYTTIDFASTIGGLTRKTVTKVKECEQWSASCKGDLTSAIAGGQWTQSRRSSVRAWGIHDTRCQFCLMYSTAKCQTCAAPWCGCRRTHRLTYASTGSALTSRT